MPASASDLNALRTAAIVAALRKSRMFADLPPGDVAIIAGGCSLRSLDKDEMLFREGVRAEGFYVVQTGRISVFRLTPDGREQIICIFQSPESFAEVTLATMETYPANAVALEPSQVVLVHKAQFRDLVCKKPELALHMLVSMSLHLKHLVQSVHDLKGRQIEARLADWLLQQAAASGGVERAFALPVSKKVLAGQLGVTSETLSRTLGRFRHENAIEVNGPRIRILDAAGLRRHKDGEEA
ncbi:MAG TPA: Crp/Fnr family transcriptional regulator [Lacunisphaera sp.]|nr:Crp/Fnr family transcriptional regulator [Lacunisphaera sp.]